MNPQDILTFWFGDDVTTIPEEQYQLWFGKSAATDQAVQAFAATREQAVRGDLNHWQESAEGVLALIILIDQFSRNLFRNDPKAFEFDLLGQELAALAVTNSFDKALTAVQRIFIYLPFEHAEDRFLQAQSVGFFTQLCHEAPEGLQQQLATTLDYAKRHQVVVERFGRFPHRNEVLGRASTSQELAFLEEPNSSF